MADLTRFEMGDPALIYERNEARAIRQAQKAIRKAAQNPFEDTMTQTQSDEIEALLLEWYRWTRAQRELLGYSRVSPMFRGADSSDVHDTGDDVDARIHAATAESVDFCVNQLDMYQSAAIQVHCRNAEAGNAVHRNPRLGTIKHTREKYLEAKELLFPLMVREGLVRRG